MANFDIFAWWPGESPSSPSSRPTRPSIQHTSIKDQVKVSSRNERLKDMAGNQSGHTHDDENREINVQEKWFLMFRGIENFPGYVRGVWKTRRGWWLCGEDVGSFLSQSPGCRFFYLFNVHKKWEYCPHQGHVRSLSSSWWRLFWTRHLGVFQSGHLWIGTGYKRKLSFWLYSSYNIKVSGWLGEYL